MATIVREAPRSAGSADEYGMSTMSLAAPLAVASGVLALLVALVAVITDAAWMVGVAAVLAVASALLVAFRPMSRRAEGSGPRPPVGPAVADRPAVQADGVDPRAAASALDPEARAAAERFEADAILARDELIRELTSRSRRADDPPGAGATAVIDPGAALLDLSGSGSGSGAAGPGAEGPVAPSLPDVDRAPGGSAGDEVVHDVVTGLFSQTFFDATLEKRVSASRRGLRPLSVAIVEVEVDVTGPEPHLADPVPLAEAMEAVFRDADTVARDDDGRFLILLEDTPENGAVWCLERLRRRVSETMPGHTTRAGLSCYPAYGFSGPQLVAQARAALELAREWPQDRIEVTAESPD